MKRRVAGIAAIGLVLIGGVWVFRSAPEDRTVVATALPASQRAVVRLPEAVAPQPRLAASPATASSTPTSRLDFDSAENLYALAVAAANSNDPMTLHNGRHAALACTVTPQSRSQYEAIVASGSGAAIENERKRAAGVVLRKCTGFLDNDDAANNELKRRLRDRLLAREGEYVPGAGQWPPSDKQIIMAIDRGDWQTFSRAFSEMWPRIWARAGIAPKSEEALLYGMASLQALCDLGQDCSPNGLGYAIQCAMHAEMCAGSWDAFNTRGISDAQLVQVRRLRREIVDAYRRKDAAYFGLTPR